MQPAKSNKMHWNVSGFCLSTGILIEKNQKTKNIYFSILTQSSQFNKPEQQTGSGQESDQQTRLLHPAHIGLLH